jgi:hypothetical protein
MVSESYKSFFIFLEREGDQRKNKSTAGRGSRSHS